MAEEPNPKRFALRAALLVLPAVVAALLLPRLYRGAHPGPTAAQGAPGATPAAVAAGIAALTGAPPADPPAPPPRPPDGPTVEQIEASRAAEEALAKAERGWRKVEFMAPRQGQAAVGGERVVPFQGFGLSIDSTPPGASVKVDGRPLGVTPILTSFACKPGDPLAIEVTLRGHRPGTRQIRCRADELVSVTIPLGR